MAPFILARLCHRSVYLRGLQLFLTRFVIPVSAPQVSYCSAAQEKCCLFSMEAALNKSCGLDRWRARGRKNKSPAAFEHHLTPTAQPFLRVVNSTSTL